MIQANTDMDTDKEESRAEIDESAILVGRILSRRLLFARVPGPARDAGPARPAAGATKCRYGVTLERTDRVDWHSINGVTLELFDLAQELGGEYDGWETTVERSTEEAGRISSEFPVDRM